MAGEKIITLPWKLEKDAPHFEGNDTKFPESFARHILTNYSKNNDKVFDPFAGLGTTLFTAEEMNRIPFGMETDPQKHQWVAGQLENWTHHLNDDAFHLDKYKLPKIDLVLTSPPYMPRHQKYNPLFGGNPKYSGYDVYLKRIEEIFKKITFIIKKNSSLVVQLDNLKHGKVFTPLVSDISMSIRKNFVQTDEVFVQWKNPKDHYPFSRYMVFKKK